MIKNRRITAIGVLSLLATIMTALALTVSPPVNNRKANDSSTNTGVFGMMDEAANNDLADKTHLSTDSTDVEIVKEYFLKEISGYVGVFDPEDRETPQLITGIAIRKLREADALMLKEGIVVRGEEELAKFLEDFGS